MHVCVHARTYNASTFVARAASVAFVWPKESAFLPAARHTYVCIFPGYQASAFSRIMYTWADLVSERKLSHDWLLLSYRDRNARGAIIETLSLL